MIEKFSLFDIFLITHFVADWLFQTKWQAENKEKNYLALFSHSLVYSLFFLLFFWIFKINLWWVLLIFLSHTVLDKRTFEYWLLKTIKKNDRQNTSQSVFLINLIAVDQILHIFIIFLILYFA